MVKNLLAMWEIGVRSLGWEDPLVIHKIEGSITLYDQFSSVQSLSLVQLFATPGMVAPQASLSVGFPRQEYTAGCHVLLQGLFLTQGANLRLLHLLCLLCCRLILYH